MSSSVMNYELLCKVFLTHNSLIVNQQILSWNEIYPFLSQLWVFVKSENADFLLIMLIRSDAQVDN